MTQKQQKQGGSGGVDDIDLGNQILSQKRKTFLKFLFTLHKHTKSSKNNLARYGVRDNNKGFVRSFTIFNKAASIHHDGKSARPRDGRAFFSQDHLSKE